MTDATRRAYEAALRKAALGYPETREDFPWGERALKVKGKVFLFLFRSEARLSLSVKLPESRHAALMLPFTRPTGYGLGKAGWVTAVLEGAPYPPLEVLRAWLDESYRAVAPKRVVAAMDAAQGGAAAKAAKAKAPRAKAKAPRAKPNAKPTKPKPPRTARRAT